jgi:hypothetical protein
MFMGNAAQTKKKPKKKMSFNRRDIGLWLFLSYITFGIGYIIWLVGVTKDVKQLTKDDSSSLLPIILAIIIPFYALVLLYRLSQKIEVEAINQNIKLIDDFALGNIIIAITPIGCPITLAIMQDAINRLTK